MWSGCIDRVQRLRWSQVYEYRWTVPGDFRRADHL